MVINGNMQINKMKELFKEESEHLIAKHWNCLMNGVAYRKQQKI